MVCDHAPEEAFAFNDPILSVLEDHLRTMRGLPRVVVVIINLVPEKDLEIMAAIHRLPEAYLGSHGRKLLGGSVAYYLLGFHPATGVSVGSLMLSLNAIPFDEVVVYVDGERALQMAKMGPLPETEDPDRP